MLYLKRILIGHEKGGARRVLLLMDPPLVSECFTSLLTPCAYVFTCLHVSHACELYVSFLCKIFIRIKKCRVHISHLHLRVNFFPFGTTVIHRVDGLSAN